MKQIPFFNYPNIFLENKKEYVDAIMNACNRGAFIMQDELFEFEEKLKSYLGVKHAIGVADGTIALVLGLKASGIKEGDEVLVPSHTFIASAAAINHVGAKPVLVDCSYDHLIDSNDILHRLNNKTKAIMPVQLNGRTANMDMILEISKKYDLAIIEDSCQALGSKFKDTYAGTFGQAGAYSFYPSKTLGSFGDGGAVVTNSDKIADSIKLYRDHGRGSDGKVTIFGYNSRLDNIQAAILLQKFKYYEDAIEKRRKLASIYNSELEDLDELILPPPPKKSGDHFDIFQNYEIEAKNRDELREFLSDNGIQTIIQWGGFMIHQFEKLNLNTDVPFTEKISKNFLLLPLNLSIKKDDIVYISSKIKEFFTKG